MGYINLKNLQNAFVTLSMTDRDDRDAVVSFLRAYGSYQRHYAAKEATQDPDAAASVEKVFKSLTFLNMLMTKKHNRPGFFNNYLVAVKGKEDAIEEIRTFVEDTLFMMAMKAN